MYSTYSKTNSTISSPSSLFLKEKKKHGGEDKSIEKENLLKLYFKIKDTLTFMPMLVSETFRAQVASLVTSWHIHT
jgi:hypothetical protein